MQRKGKERPTPERAFAEVLRKVRKEKGLSQEQLGFDSGYHRTYIGMLERALMNPSLRTILSISAALSISAGEFVSMIEGELGEPWRQPERKVGRRA